MTATDTTIDHDQQAKARLMSRIRVLRLPVRDLSIGRIVKGGRITDAGRLPRYAAFFLLGLAGIWAPISGYLATAPLRYTTNISLILPGSGASASVNLSDIGQSSSFANSAFASNSVSPTVTYQRLIGADRIVDAAATGMQMRKRDFGTPRIELVDQTGLIRVQMVGNSPEDAQARGKALVAAFFTELDALRADELDVRQTGGKGAIDDYRASVGATRAAIANLQTETGLVSGDQYDAMVIEADALDTRVRDLAGSLSQKTQAAAALEATLGLTPQLAVAALKLNADSEFSAIIADMATKAARLAEVEGQYGNAHPKVTEARSGHSAARDRSQERAVQITGLTAQDIARLDLAPMGAQAALLAQLVQLDAERSGLAAEYSGMTRRLKDETARVRALASTAARLEDLKRDFTVAEAVFASAIARSQSTKSDIYASYPLVQVLEDPSLPDSPSSPKRMLVVAAGSAATVMLLMGLALGWLRSTLIGRLLKTPAERLHDA